MAQNTHRFLFSRQRLVDHMTERRAVPDSAVGTADARIPDLENDRYRVRRVLPFIQER